MKPFATTLPVILAGLLGAFTNFSGDDKPRDNPFQEVERSTSVASVPAIHKSLQDLRNQSMEMGGRLDQCEDALASTGKSISTIAVRLTAIQQDQAATSTAIQKLEKSSGAGFQLPPESNTAENCPCDGKCLTEADVRKIVSSEFDNQMLAQAAAPRGYGPQFAAPTVTRVSYHTAPPVTAPPQVIHVAPARQVGPIRRIFFGGDGPTTCVQTPYGTVCQ